MNPYAKFLAEDRRITILRLLLESPGYRANEYTVSTFLDSCGHSVSTDQLHTDFAWLQEQGLLQINVVADMQVATLTKRGQDVAEGRAVVPGVKRPSAL